MLPARPALASELRALEARLREGGGAATRSSGSTSRESSPRASASRCCCDPGHALPRDRPARRLRQYDGQAPAAGVVTGIGMVHGREVVVVANDATVKAGSWWPETIKKILRAQEIAMRCRIPIVYLVDSAGVNLPYQGGVFPGQYGASRIFYYNSIMRRYLRIPQLAAVMGPCIAGGAYLPALSDVILMVKGTSFMGLGGPNLVKGATGQMIDGERSAARARTRRSQRRRALRVPDDDACVCEAARARRRGCRVRRAIGMRSAPSASASAARSSDRVARTTCFPPIIACPTTCTRCCARSSTTASSTRFQERPRARDDLRRRAHRRHSGRHHREPARPDQGTRRREAALRRDHLRGERGEGRVLHRPLRPAGHSAAVRAGRLGLHGRARRPSTRGSFARARASSRRWRRRACRRSCSRSITRRAPATTRWRGRASIPTSSSAGRRDAWA